MTVSATDASDNVGTQDVIITVTETNEDPVLANIGPRSASPGAELLISLSAADSDVPQDALAYARNGTSGAITATSTRAASFAWTPTGADLGPHVIRFTVSDGAGGTDSEDVVITVSDETAPAITSGATAAFTEHAAGTHALTSDEQGVTFAIVSHNATGSPLPAIAGSTLSWTPSEEHGGNKYRVTVSATDASDNVGTQDVIITVTETNEDPVLANIGPRSASPGAELLISLSAADSDVPQDALAYARNGTSGAITATSTRAASFAWTPTGADLGPHVIRFTVSDGAGGTDSEDVVITVSDETAPAITSGATAAFTEHAAGTHALTSDEQGVTFAIVSHNATGSPLPAIAGSTLSWTPSEEHGGNKYRVTVSATDASDNVGTQDVIITVTETNEDPVLANIGPRSASPGAELLISLSAADSDVPQDALAYARNGTSGAITATSTRAASFAWTPTGADLGPHVIRFTVSDGAGGTDSEDVVITVSDETAPAITSGATAAFTEHAAGTHALTSDEQGVTFAIVSHNATGSPLPAIAGSTLSWTPSEEHGGNKYRVTVSATDASDNVGTQDVIITVTETNEDPVLANIGPRSASPGAELLISLSAADSDVPQDALAYARNGTSGAITATSTRAASFAWTPTGADLGPHVIRFTVSDGAGGTDSEDVVITVSDETAPAITSGATAAFTEHAAGTHALTSDEQGVTFAIVSHNATGSPLPAIAGSTLSWTPSEEHGGNKYRVTVSATDASDNVGTQDVIITVTETNEDPVLANIGPRSASPGAELLISLSAADSDVPQDALAYARNGTSGAITATSTRAASFAWTPTGADLGPHVIRFTVSDGAGGTDSEDVVITVSDGVPPVIAPKGNVTIQGTPPLIVTYAAPTATDAVDGAVPVTCTPASGSTFTQASTAVTCSARDAAGNSAAPVTFHVIVTTAPDTTAPTVTPTAILPAEATGATTPVPIPLPTVTDDRDSRQDITVQTNVTGTYTTVTGAVSHQFAVGTHTVHWRAADTSGNTGTATQSVTVRDTTPPAIAPKNDVTRHGDVPLAVTYAAPTATDAVDGAVPVTCTPASGSAFTQASTAVTCSARDAAGNSAEPVTFSIIIASATDTTPPAIVSAALNLHPGVRTLTVTLDEPVDVSATDLSKLSITENEGSANITLTGTTASQDALAAGIWHAQGGGANPADAVRAVGYAPQDAAATASIWYAQSGDNNPNGVRLTGATIATTTDGPTITIILTEQQRAAIQEMSSHRLRAEPGAFADIAGNAIEDTTYDGIAITQDTARPAISSATLNLGSDGRTLAISFDKVMDTSATDLTKLSVSQSDGSGAVGLAGASVATDADGTTIVIRMTESQRAKIWDLPSRALNVGEGAFADVSGNAVAAVLYAGVAVIGIESDTTKPVITLVGQPEVTVAKDQPYVDAGAVCADDTDGPVATVVSNPVDTAVPGVYVVVYGCTDAAGNDADGAKRTVRVSDAPPRPEPRDGARSGGGGDVGRSVLTLSPMAVAYDQCGPAGYLALLAATYGDNLASSLTYGDTRTAGVEITDFVDLDEHVQSSVPAKLHVFIYAGIPTDVSSFAVAIHDRSGKEIRTPLLTSDRCSGVIRFADVHGRVLPGIDVRDSFIEVLPDADAGADATAPESAPAKAPDPAGGARGGMANGTAGAGAEDPGPAPEMRVSGAAQAPGGEAPAGAPDADEPGRADAPPAPGADAQDRDPDREPVATGNGTSGADAGPGGDGRGLAGHDGMRTVLPHVILEGLFRAASDAPAGTDAVAHGQPGAARAGALAAPAGRGDPPVAGAAPQPRPAGIGSGNPVAATTGQPADAEPPAGSAAAPGGAAATTGQPADAAPRTDGPRRDAPNRDPVLGHVPARGATVGIPLSIHLDATDADGDALTFRTNATGAWMAAHSGHFAWTPQAADFGMNYIELAASDPAGGTDAVILAVDVTTVPNSAPEFGPMDPAGAYEHLQLRLDLAATDADGDALAYSFAGYDPAPENATLDPDTGVFRWTPGETQQGRHVFSVLASDHRSDPVRLTVSVEVEESNEPPRLALPFGPAVNVTVGTVFEVGVGAADADRPHDALTFATNMTGAAFDPDTGSLTWTPHSPDIGERAVWFGVSDGRGGTDEAVVLIRVVATSAAG